MDYIVVVLCILMNAFLAAIEMAFVVTSKPQLKRLANQGRNDAKMLLTLRENPERTLSILQIGLTFFASISAAVGGLSVSSALKPYFTNLGFGSALADTLSIACVVLPLTFLSVVFGELLPKSFALKNPLNVALKGAKLLVYIDRPFRPLVNVLEKTTKLFLGLIFPKSKTPEASAADDISISDLKKEHAQYVVNLVDLEQKKVRDVMIPWSQVVCARTNQTADEVANLVLNSGHTRLPVLNETSDTLAGVLHTKEFLSFYRAGGQDWPNLIRPAVTFGEEESLIRMLRKLQETRRHMGMIVTRDSRVLGIITLEDIIEEIVGEIYDEDDDGTLRKLLSLESHTKLYKPFKK